MKRPAFALLAAVVIAAHAAFFWLAAGARALPRTPHVPPSPPPNFGSRSAEITDPATGEKLIYREFTVSTKLPRQRAAPGGANE